MTLTYGSVCSGIEAASVAWEPLGCKPLWFAEIDKAPSRVLAHHWPHVPNHGDMCLLADRIRAGEVPAPDVLVGGTPCQSYSIAGARGGLSDPRGRLTLEFVRIVEAIDAVRDTPCIVVWENVPGVLSHKDNPFGNFVAALAGEDDPVEPPGRKWTNAGLVCGPARAVAWRTLDAQFFGLAQRRERVFVVASALDGFDPAAVLFEWDGMHRNYSSSREARKELTAALAHRAVPGGFIAPVAPTIPARTSGGGGLGTDFDCDGGLVCINARQDPLNYGDMCGPLDVDPHTYAIQERAISENPNASPDGIGVQADVAYTLEARSVPQAVCGQVGVVCFGGGNTSGPIDVAACLVAAGMKLDFEVETFAVREQGGPRRLMPVECERLQGFPDGHTAIAKDGPRYKMLGNSMAVPVMRWIMRRVLSAI